MHASFKNARSMEVTWRRAVGALALSVLLATPVLAQNLQAVRPMVAPTPQVNTVQIDYKQQFEKSQLRNKQLRLENEDLRAKLAQWTSKGGSLVHAYCETPTLSRNSAGADSNCATNGYTCEPVSGLCRTMVRSSAECAPGFLMDIDHCVPQPR
ncbi:hypothetical protein [Lysobacter fragariae]